MRGSGSSSLGAWGAQAYGEASYWDKRYSQAQDPAAAPFDWYQQYPALAPLFHLYIPPSSQSHPHLRLLVVGCGNSAFSEGMVNDGYCDIFNIDISSVAIEAMQKKYSACPQLKFMKMDVRDMCDFAAGSFDAVVDKGTLDSILCGHDSRDNATKMLKEVGRYMKSIDDKLYRVLKDGGIYFLITYGAPNYRLSLLRNSYPWTIKLHVIDKFPSSKSSEHQASELTSPVPLDDNGSSVDTFLGKDREVHYIYVCVKDNKHQLAS